MKPSLRLSPIVASLLVAAACSSATSDSTTAESTSASASTAATTTTTSAGTAGGIGDSAFDAEPVLGPLAAARAANDGFLSTQDAIDLFAAVYGTVPGADPTRFDPGPGDASMALRNVFRVFDDLSTAQQDAVMALAGGPAPQASAPAAAVDVAYRQTDYEAAVAAAETQIAAHLGRDLGLVVEVQTGVTLADADADAGPFGPGGLFEPPYDRCVIRFATGLFGDYLSDVAAHEMFHCFQFTFPGYSTDAPDWIVEGQASWVGARVGGVDEDTEGRFEDWVNGTLNSLFTKDYDAAGFYWVIEQAGVDPWAVMPAMFGHSSVEAVAATGLGGAEAMRWVGTTTARAEVAPAVPLSSDWMLGSDAPEFGVRGRVTVTKDAPYERERGMQPYSASGSVDLRLEGDEVTVTLAADSGGFQFFDHGFTPFEGNYMKKFCLREDGTGCSCGSDGEEEIEPGSDRLFVAVGNADGGSASISVKVKQYDKGFGDGTWTGEFTSTIITAAIDDSDVVGDPLSAPFEMTVDGGRVEGTYSVAMYETVTTPTGTAEGVGTISGVITGCWFAPRLVATNFDFEGTVTIDGVTAPFPFSLPFGEGEAGSTDWRFDESTDQHQATGTLDTTPYLEFMRSVGVDVNDVEIAFQATNGS